MRQNDLTDGQGRYRGTVTERDGRKTVTDGRGRYAGEYDEKSNTTTDRDGKFYGDGDQSSSVAEGD